MTSTFPQRVEFEDHRFIQAIDLQDEQLYHVQRRWQHNLSLHSWGILCGLEVRIEGSTRQQPNVIIHPGMVLDGYGRELVVTVPMTVSESFPVLNPEINYDIWITYGVSLENNAITEEDSSPGSLDSCDTPPDTNMRRLLERPQVLVKPTSTRQSGSVTQPREVPIGDLFFTPDRPMKFDPSVQWPVFLCELAYSGNAWGVDPSERHYGGLIAERIEMPFQTRLDTDPLTRQTAILNGGHPERPDWRFAVLDVPPPNAKNKRDEMHVLPDNFPVPLSIRSVPLTDPQPATTGAQRATKEAPPAMTEIRWQAERVVAEADLVMRGGAGIQFEATPPGEKPLDPTSGWGIYRQFRPRANNPVAAAQAQTNSSSTPPPAATVDAPTDDNTKQFADVLQISMPQSDQSRNSVAVGAGGCRLQILPILVVNDDESVDIFGILRVHGTIYGDTTDLPPLDTASAYEFFKNWLKEKVTSSEGTSLVEIVAENADPGIFQAGLAATGIAKQRSLYKALAKQLTDLMSNDPVGVDFADKFAAAIGTAADDAEKNLYRALVDNANDFTKNFSSGMGLANKDKQRILFIALATRLVELISNDTDGKDFADKFAAAIGNAAGDAEKNLYRAFVDTGDAFKNNFSAAIATADKAKQRNLFIELAKQLTELMSNDHDGSDYADNFAAAIATADNDAEKNLYNALAHQIVTLMSVDDTSANSYCLKLVDGTGEVAKQLRFCKAMIQLGSSVLGPNSSVEALANGSKWQDILAYSWRKQAMVLGTAFSSNAAADPTDIDGFVSNLTDEATARKLKDKLQAKFP